MTKPAPAATLRRLDNGLPVLTWPGFDALQVETFVTVREPGESRGRFAGLNLGLHVGDEPEAVLANRARVAGGLGTTPADFVFADQAHGREVLIVGDEHRGRGSRTQDDAIAATDALITAVPGIALVVLVADCVPLVLLDPSAQVLACVHAGWRGIVSGVIPSALDAMRTLGAEPARVVAGIGPCIGADDYQVGDDVRVAAQQTFGVDVDTVQRPDGAGRWHFDLRAASALQLRRAGVPQRQIQIAGQCTGPGTPFYSHRLEGPTGRFAAIARLCDGTAQRATRLADPSI